MKIYRGISDKHKGDPWASQHHAIYFTRDPRVAERYGKSGGVFEFELPDNLRISPTEELNKLLEESDYPEMAGDYSKANLDEAPIFGADPQSESIAQNLNIHGVEDRKGNIEMLPGGWAEGINPKKLGTLELEDLIALENMKHVRGRDY